MITVTDMWRKTLIILSVVIGLLLPAAASAAVADTTSVPVLSDSLAAALDDALKGEKKEVKERDRGYDATRYRMQKRYQPVDKIKFESKNFMDNTFFSLQERRLKLMSPDYSFGLMSALSFGKWYHEDHAVKINASAGRWTDNFNAEHIWAGEVSLSYMFNLTSYLGGYRPERYCNLNIVAGAGLAASGYTGNVGAAFQGHVGINLSMKLASALDFFIEPLAAVYSNGMAVSRAENWRPWLAAFSGSIGLNVNIGHPKVKLLDRRWFMSMMVGPNAQNAEMIYDEIGFGKGLGVHANLGVGHYVLDWLAIRGTFAYYRHKWVVYDQMPYYANYYAIRVEGMMDLVNLISRKDRHLLSVSLVGGPELGYMHKNDFGTVVWQIPYIGLAGGVQVKFNLTDRFRVFIEPRGSLVPYCAPANDRTTLNDYVNYYDALMNINVGIEFDL